MSSIFNLIRDTFSAVVGGILFLYPWQIVAAAENTVQAELSAARTIMEQLDQLASACLATEQEAGSQDSPCLNFTEAINGDLLANYIERCRAVKTWRDEFVSSQTRTGSVTNDAGEFLNLMVDSEFLCGDNALVNRSQSIRQAYQLVNASSRSEFANSSSSSSELSELRQRMLISQERDRLMNSFRQQQQRQQLETQRQFDRQELELIRQQILPGN